MQENEGPWRIVQNEEFFDVTKDPADQDAWFATFAIEGYGRAEALSAAHAEAARLNAIWREEEQARRRDAAHAEALEEDRRREKARRIAAFVAFYQSHPLDWFWSAESDNREYWIAPNGGSFSRQQDFRDTSERVLIPRAELEAALLAAGVEEPVTISDELRARLEKRWDVAISVFIPCVDETLVDEDGNSNQNNGHRFTRQQALAFLREKGIEVSND